MKDKSEKHRDDQCHNEFGDCIDNGLIEQFKYILTDCAVPDLLNVVDT